MPRSRPVRAVRIPRVFHYLYNNTMEVGASWRDQLQGRLQSVQLFIALITRSYWESEWCRSEYQLAEERQKLGLLQIYPYFLDDSLNISPVALQGRTLNKMPLDERLSAIVGDIDRYLTRGDDS